MGKKESNHRPPGAVKPPPPPGPPSISYRRVWKINNNIALDILSKHPPSKAIGIINESENIPYGDIKIAEEHLKNAGISCSVIDGQLFLGGM